MQETHKVLRQVNFTEAQSRSGACEASTVETTADEQLAATGGNNTKRKKKANCCPRDATTCQNLHRNTDLIFKKHKKTAESGLDLSSCWSDLSVCVLVSLGAADSSWAVLLVGEIRHL